MALQLLIAVLEFAFSYFMFKAGVSFQHDVLIWIYRIYSTGRTEDADHH